MPILPSILLALSALPEIARADAFLCSAQNLPAGVGTWLCAGTGTSGEIGWSSTVIQPDAISAVPVSAASAGENGGDFAGSGFASSSAEPGRLSGQATASVFGGPRSRASAGAQARFYERGSLAPLGGASPGDPVTLRLTLEAAGSAATSSAGVDGRVTIRRGLGIIYNRIFFISIFDLDWSEQVVLPPLVVGDEVSIDAQIYSFALANGDPGPTSSSSAVGNPVRVSLDVTSGNAVFASSSGYDYRTAPEPGTAAAIALGALALAGLSTRRIVRRGGSLPVARVVAGRVEDDLRGRSA